jgi:hypothetical protein
MHLIDANILITAHNTYYPTNRIPEFWSWILNKAQAGLVKMPLEMIEEVQGGTGDAEKDLLFDWLQQDGVIPVLRLEEEVDPHHLQKVLDDGYGQNLTDVDIEKIGRDPFIMAYAMASPADRHVVSNEISRPNAQGANRKIPDICKQFGLSSCNAFRLIRQLDFKTAWGDD